MSNRFNVIWACPNCGNHNDDKHYYNEGPIKELQCDNCQEIVPLGLNNYSEHELRLLTLITSDNFKVVTYDNHIVVYTNGKVDITVPKHKDEPTPILSPNEIMQFSKYSISFKGNN